MSLNKTFSGDVTNAGGGTVLTLETSVAGAGLTGAGGSPLAVGAGTGLTVNANDVAVNYASTTNVLTGTATNVAANPDSIAALWESGADNTDGATITLGEGGCFNLITSTTAITAFVFSTDKAGRRAVIRFNTVRTLTHNGTSLILPTAASITTAAGDQCQIQSLGSGNFRINWYQRADGTPLAGSLAAIADDTFLANISGGSATPTAVALTTLAGAGLTGGADAILAVGAGNFITINANDVALTTVAAGRVYGNQIDAGGAATVALTGAELAEIIRFSNRVTEPAGGALDDYALDTLADVLNITTTSVLSGIAMAVASSGRKIIVANGAASGSGVTVDILNFSGLSTGGNRIVTPKAATLRLYPGDAVELQHGVTGNFWFVVEGVKAYYRTNSSGLGAARGRVNFVNSTSATWSNADVSADDEVTISAQRAALTGAISASANSNATLFSGILDNGAAETNRTNLNFVSGTNTTVTVTDDAGNDELEVSVSVTSFPLTGLASQADDTFLANISGGAAPPTAVALTTLAGAGLTGGADAILAVGAGTGITVNANDVALSTIAAESFFVNGTAGAAVPTAIAGSTVAGAGLTYTTGGILAVGSSTSITVNANDIQRPALTGAISASANSNATLFSGILDNGVAETDRTNLNFIAGTNTTATITDDAGNDELEIRFNVDDFPLTGLADQATATFLANITGGSAPPTAHSLATFAGAGLTYTNVTGIMAVGAGTGITVNANDVQISTIAAESFFINGTAGAAVPTAIAGSTVAGAGLTYTTGGILAVGAGTGTTVNANDVAINFASTTNVLTGTATNVAATPDAIAALWEAGTDNAGGATITMGEGGSFNLITSTTAITALAFTTDKAARTAVLRFNTIRTLTHNGTSLILPTAASITTAVGDICQAESLGSGNFRVNWYTRANGTPLAGSLASIADDTFLANISGGAALPTAVALTTLAGAGLTGGADAILAVGAGTGITVNANDVQLSTIAAESFFVNGTAGAAVPTAIAGSTVAGAGLTYTTGGILAVGAGTGITSNANDVAVNFASTTNILTGTATNVSATPDAIAALWEAGADNAGGATITMGEGGSFNLITSTTAITALAFTTDKAGRCAILRFNTIRTLTHNATSLILPTAASITTAVGDVCEAISLGSGNFRVNWYTRANGTPLAGSLSAIADDTFLANISGGSTTPTAVALTTLAGAGLTGGADAILAVGAGTRITVNANDVQLAAGAAESFLMNATAGSAVADYRAGSSVAGAGLIYAAGGTLNQGWTESTIGTGGALNNQALASSVGVLQFSSGSLSLSGVVSSGRERGSPLYVRYGGVGFVQLPHESASSTDVNRFFNHGSNTLELTPGETALYIPVDTDTSGTDAKRWQLVSHRWPFYHSPSLSDGDTIMHDGSDWQAVTEQSIFLRRRQRSRWEEDFEYCPTSGSATTAGKTLSFGSTNWYLEGIADTCTYTQRTPEASHPGIFAITSSNTTNDGFIMYRGAEANIGAGALLASDVGDLEVVIAIPDTTTVYFDFGFADTVSGGTNAILIYYDTSVNANIHLYTESAATGLSTDTDTGIAPGTGWQVLRISRSSTTMTFFRNDVSLGTISTNIPAAVDVNPRLRMLTRGAATRRLDIDYIGYQSKELGARF
jgi:hypothetical protein